MSIVLSAGQAAAKEMVARFRAQNDVLVAVVTGYAGTGKTTLIRELASSDDQPTVLTPTGKAALRVGEATGLYGQTIHRFLYDPSEDPKTGAPTFKLKDLWDDSLLDMKGKLVLIDEASMVDRDVWRDLCTVARAAGFHILLMGDLFQLPPVLKDKTGEPFSTLNVETPFRVNLTEVHRQALDSPIIRASMILRSGQPEFMAMRLLEASLKSQVIESVLATRAAGGATICYTNGRRHDLNNRVRVALGHKEGTVEPGEPLLVTQNNYSLNVYNGEIIDFSGWQPLRAPDESIVVTDRFSQSSLHMSFGVTNVGDVAATLSPEEIMGKAETAKIGAWTVRRAARFWYKDEFRAEDAPPHLAANYGYALTVHKAQGSEWPEILIVIDESLGALNGLEKKRWLYTALTRGKHTVRYVYIDGRATKENP